jgi:hypothetical protein
VLFFQTARCHVQDDSNVERMSCLTRWRKYPSMITCLPHITILKVLCHVNLQFVVSLQFFKVVCHVKIAVCCFSSVWKAYNYTGQCISLCITLCNSWYRSVNLGSGKWCKEVDFVGEWIACRDDFYRQAYVIPQNQRCFLRLMSELRHFMFTLMWYSMQIYANYYT